MTLQDPEQPGKRRFPGMVPGMNTERRQVMDKTQNNREQVDEREKSEARIRAQDYILAAIEEGQSPEDILDGLASFYDGDPLELF